MNTATNERCCYCDDTGDVHSPDGEWRGVCSCAAGRAIKELQMANAITECYSEKRTSGPTPQKEKT